MTTALRLRQYNCPGTTVTVYFSCLIASPAGYCNHEGPSRGGAGYQCRPGVGQDQNKGTAHVYCIHAQQHAEILSKICPPHTQLV